jgi:hypothetical protein
VEVIQVNDSFTKLIAVVLSVYFLWVVFLKDSDEYNVNVQTSVSASDGLNLKTIGPLLKTAKDAEDLEKLINDPSQGVNNLDLNEDDKVDYINVTEYGEGENRGFSLTTDMGEGQVQEIATIQIEKMGEDANVQIQGNQSIYGQNHYYHNRMPGIGTYLLMSYMFRPHPFYRSPWGFGYYPSYYRSYGRVSSRSYNSRVSGQSRNSGYSQSKSSKMSSKVTSPNKGMSSSKIKAPLKNPTTSQKSFQKRNPSKRARSGGFGRSSRGSVKRSSSGRSRGGFGRGK